MSDSPPRHPIDPRWIDAIVDALEGLTFGEVLVTVHDGRVVQVTRTQRTRLPDLERKR